MAQLIDLPAPGTIVIVWFFPWCAPGDARRAFLARSALLARSTELGICRSVYSDIGLQPGDRTEHEFSRTLGAPGFHPPLQGPELCPGGVEVRHPLR